MRWRRIAFWSGSGLLAIVVCVISWLFLADLGSFKPQIERWASEKTGRQVSIDGDLHIDLARHSSLVAENIRISNAEWAEQADMLSVGRIEVQLDLAAILDGLIVVELIDVDDATIFLTQPEQGDPNWVMIEPSAEVADEPEDGGKTAIFFKKVEIDRVGLTYSSPQRAEPIDVHIEQLRQTLKDDDLLSLSLDGTLNGRQMKLDGEVGTWDALLARQDVQFNLGMRLDTFSVHADGRIDDLLNPHRPRINFSAKAPDVNDLLQALGVSHEGEGVIDLVGSLKPEDQGSLVLDVAGEIGRLQVNARGDFSNLSDYEDVDIDLTATGEDVRPILEAFGFPQTKPVPFMIDLDAARHGKALIVERAEMAFGEAKLGLSASLPDFPSIDDGDVELHIDGPDLERFREVFSLPGTATGPFSAGFTIDVGDDGFELAVIDVQTSLGRLRADGKIGDAPDYFGTTIDLAISSNSLAGIASAYRIDDMPDEPIEVRGAINYGPDGIRSIRSLTVTVNDLTAKVDGLIKPVKGLLGSDIEFAIDGPDLAKLVGAFAANTGVPVQPYGLDGQLQIRDDGYRFRDVTGKIGTSDIEFDGLLVPRGGIVGSRFNVAAKGAAFTEMTDSLGEIGVRSGPYEFSGSVTFERDHIRFDAIELTRARGKVEMDLQLGMPLSRRWVSLDIQASGPDVQSLFKGFRDFEFLQAPFRADIQGMLRDTTLSVENLDVSVGVANLSAEGSLELAGDLSSTKFGVRLSVPNLSELSVYSGARLRDQSFTLNANVTGGGDLLRIDGLHATLGESDIRGDVQYRRGDIPQLDVSIRSDAITLSPLLELGEPAYDPSPEFDDGRLIPDIKIPFEAMAKLDANVELEIGELHRDALHLRDIVFRAVLQDGALDISEAQFQARSGALAARVNLDPNAGQGKAKFEMVARDLALGLTGFNSNAAMTGSINMNLESTGTDLRSLFGNANGIFVLETTGGRSGDSRFIHALYGNMLEEIIGTINPFYETDAHTNFDCIIAPLEFAEGKVTSNPRLLTVTDKMRMLVDPKIDLKDESLDISIESTPRKGISFSAGEILNPYIKIVGTLAAPRLAIDETGVLISGGAAVATAGLSVLARAAWVRFSRSKQPCVDAREEVLENLGDRFSELEVAIVPADSEAQP